MPTKIQLKRGLSTNFTPATILAPGEPAFLTDLGKLYIGDGIDKVLINPIDKPAGISTTDNIIKFKVNEYGQVVQQLPLLATDIPDIQHTQVIGLGTVSTENVGTTAGTIPMLDETSKLPISTIPSLNSSMISDLGTVATLDTGISSGNVPVLDANGKLAASMIPSIAITDVFTVSSLKEMLALDADVGDVAIRTDINATFILKASPASLEENWVQLATPTDTVTSVNGFTGVVVLGASDILMTGYEIPKEYTPIEITDSSSVAIGKIEKNFDNYAPIDSPQLIGLPTAPTPATDDNSTKIATTEYVKSNLEPLAPLSSPIFIGNPTTPTAIYGDSTLSIANTEFVQKAISIIDGGTF